MTTLPLLAPPSLAAPAGTAPDDERAELLHLLRSEAILYRSENQPVLSRDGSSARWMLDSLAVTLTPRGAALAARSLLRALAPFEGRQLATFGLTGVPLLQGCVLQGNGRYSGILVRKERKAHGSLKLVEGRLDTAEPVVMVDDSISSGHSMLTCARRLEEAGFQVEGGVCLVRFGYDRGTARMLESGYRAATVFDIYDDFIPFMDGEPDYPLNPTKQLVPSAGPGQGATEALHPAALAREVMAEYLRSGQVLRAPRALDRVYDGDGGCWVSVRRRSRMHERPARSGFWHFPGEERGRVPEDVVRAAVQTAGQLRDHPDPLTLLDECALAVTFFGELEECTVGDLDNDRYGIVVRSRERASRMGGALPRMPGIANEWQQYVHAARRNARLLPLEPHLLYRHTVEKVVEPGVTWQPTGVPAPPRRSWHGDVDVAGPVAKAARTLVLREIGAAPAHGKPIRLSLPADVVGLFVTVYADGRLIGCAGAFGDDCGARLTEFVPAAVHDRRFPDATATDQVAVGVSLLSGRHEIGQASPEWVVGPTRFADQALEVRQRDRWGFVLPFVAVTHNLTPQQYVLEVVDKAGITRPPYSWTRYDCATWLADESGVRQMRHALPVGAPAGSSTAERERLEGLLLRYTRRHSVPRDEPYLARYDVFADRLHTGAHAARIAYGAWIKARAGLRREAADDLARGHLRRDPDGWIGDSIAESAFVLLAELELGPATGETERTVRTIAARIDGHGRFATHREPAAAHEPFQDYAPGQALLALAAAAGRGIDVPAEAVSRALRHYRMRFRQNTAWGAVAWLTQAYAAWGALRSDDELTGFAFEIADRAVTFQSRKNGGFLNDHQRDAPGATTALYLEGIIAARSAADRVGDRTREQRYRTACTSGLAFLDSLVYQPRDTVVLPNPEWALGGVRTSETASDVRVDYVHHALSAVLGLRGVVGVDER
ncbi:AMMECR1 domain-containing protein [Blastococcus deserti]|uniref:AMMECR1 domain-containing protein n=1 Tax=Blastococcus deserti TaxID=2259033 RepID=A0ABW4X5C8_9ACTN